MHRIFGKKLSGTYCDRRGAYVIPIAGDTVAVIETPKGLFLLGGGVEADETDEECLIRECLEESGFRVEVGEPICSAEAFVEHTVIGLFHPIQSYYYGTLTEKIKAPSETEHELKWIKTDELKEKMFSEMQDWAIGVAVEKLKTQNKTEN